MGNQNRERSSVESHALLNRIDRRWLCDLGRSRRDGKRLLLNGQVGLLLRAEEERCALRTVTSCRSWSRACAACFLPSRSPPFLLIALGPGRRLSLTGRPKQRKPFSRPRCLPWPTLASVLVAGQEVAFLLSRFLACRSKWPLPSLTRIANSLVP